MRLGGTFVLTPDLTGTEVSLRANLEPEGVFKLLAPLLGPVLRRQNRAAALRLKQALEARRATPSGRAGDR